MSGYSDAELESAVYHDNSSFISSWLRSLTDEERKAETTRAKQAMVLRKASLYHNLGVIKIVLQLSKEIFTDIVNCADGFGKVPLHYVAEGYQPQGAEPSKTLYNILNIIGVLFEHDANPIIKSKEEKTPKEVAIITKFTIGAVLFEILEGIWTNTCKQSVLNYEDVVHLHRILFEWAIKQQYIRIAKYILSIPTTLSSKEFDFLRGLEDLNGKILLHVIATIGNPELFEILISHCDLSLNTIANRKWEQFNSRRNRHIETTLSLAILHESLNDFIEIFVKHQSKGNYLTHIDLSGTNIASFPTELFSFHHVTNLNLSNNRIENFPQFGLLSESPQNLTELNLSCNSLTHLPAEIFQLPRLQNFDASNNPLVGLPDKWWTSRSLENLNLSQTQIGDLHLFMGQRKEYTNSMPVSSPKHLTRTYRVASRTALLRRTEEPMAFLNKSDGTSVLRRLNVSSACLNKFPKCLACLFPNLKQLNISGNNIASCCAINELPAMLEELDVSQNKLQSNHVSIFSMLFDDNYHVCCNPDVNNGQAYSCHHMKHNKLLKLKSLNLSGNNNLKNVVLHSGDSLGKSVNLFFPKLRKLNLNNCNLQQSPEHLVKLTELNSLNISNNDIKIPHHICNLNNLKVFAYEGVKDPIATELNKFTTIIEKQIFLRHQNASGVPSVKLMFVGLKNQGKTTLLHHVIYDRKAPGKASPTVGIATEQTWLYSPKPSVDPTIAFYPWDFSGDERYSTAHECFIAKRAIYVLCWRASDGEAGILELKEWLLLIKARAKYAVVMIVGTHIDLVDHFPKKKALFEQEIEYYYSNTAFYPEIKAITFVSYKGKSKHAVSKLCHKLYDIAASMETYLGGKGFTQQLISMKIPDSYYRLQGEIMAAGHSFKTPILHQEDINRLGSKYGLDESEIAVAITYIKEHGMLMHFDSSELKSFYFVNPQWLCNVFAHVVLSTNHFTASGDGKIKKHKLEESLAKTFQLSPDLMEPVITLLQNFELAIPLSINTLLIPPFIQNKEPKKLFSSEHYNFPRKKCAMVFEDDTSTMTSRRTDKILFFSAELMPVDLCSTGMCFRRLFLAHHIPASIWPKLIARFLLSVGQNSFHKIICDNCVPCVPYKLTSSAGDALIGSLLCKWSYGKNYIELNLGEYSILRINALFSKEENKIVSATRNKLENMVVHKQNKETIEELMQQQEGFEVSVSDYVVISRSEDDTKVHQSDLMSMQVLSHVLEIIDEVLRDWFEGLSERGIYSDNYLSHIIPCPFCCGDSHVDSNDNDDDENTYKSEKITSIAFSIQYLLQQARVSSSITCPNHGELEIKYLAPDVVFNDIAVKKIKETDLENECDLGQGGFGVVRKMKFYVQGEVQNVAVKSFFGGLMNTGDDGNELIQMYADMRQELNKLVAVNHSNIVKCIGFCLKLLSFVLEWAPFGSTVDVMESYSRSGCHLCPKSLVYTIKQVSSALVYLHCKAIVHYDIKPGNILVFRFPQVGHSCLTTNESVKCMACQSQDGGVLVKLADLGISAFVGPGGFHRKPSSPGHTAPEALKYAGKEPLSEKVDIFSVGITLYELMTLQGLPPPNTDYFEFDQDIESGLRPPLFTRDKDPKYPIILKELVVNCWAQDYTARPSAQEIVSILQSPDCLKLSNAYNTELPYTAVSTALVVGSNDQQSLWLAHTTGDRYTVTVYEFAEGINFIATNVEMENSVQAMCQIGANVWMILKPGYLVAIDIDTFEVVHHIIIPELENEQVVTMVTIDNQAEQYVIVCKNGLLIVVSACSKVIKQNHDFLSSIAAKGTSEKENVKLSMIHVISSQLNAVEVCTPQNSNQVELWCGCDNGIIEIYSNPCNNTAGKLELLTVLDSHIHLTNASQDASAGIVQLKSYINAHMMYALHSCGRVISCWNISEQPALNSVIRLTQLSSPATTILPLNNHLYIATRDGNVHEMHMVESNSPSKVLVGAHQSSMMVRLFALHGRINTNGFLSNIGSATPDSDEELIRHVPCNVLLGMGPGYDDLFHHKQLQTVNPLLYFITWVFPLP